MATKIIPKKSSVTAKIPLTTDLEIGELAVNLTDGILYTKNSSNTITQLGGGASDTVTQEIPIKADVALAKGDVVYAIGAVGNSGTILVSKFIANNTIDELYVIGLAKTDMAIGDVGFALTAGEITGASTNGSSVGETWVDGTILYASATTAGKLTSVAPTSPNLAINVAMVLNAHASNGQLFVRITPGFHLSELHDVDITSIAAGELLKWNGSVWVNNTLSEAGIQPSGSYLTGNQTITLSGDLTGSGTTSINAQLAANVVGANELNVTGNGTAGQALLSDGDGTLSWGSPSVNFNDLINKTGGTGDYTTTGTVTGAALYSTSGFFENSQTVSANYTLVATRNAMSAGPITVDAGVTVTIETGARLVVI